VRQDQIRLPNGQVTEYNVVQHGGAVWVVPVTTEGKMVLLRHYRYTVHDWCLEVPAGGIGEGERPEDVARRELREETGGRAQAWHYVGQFYTGNGTSDEVGHVFLATGVMLREPEHEPAEVIEICPTHLQEALRMAHANEISDGPSALAIMLSEPFLQELVGKIEVSRAEKL
jgi:ADP-ribose pyrophosphatase